jgi:hypothetical protein
MSNGMVERFNGRTTDAILESHRFDSAQDMA